MEQRIQDQIRDQIHAFFIKASGGIAGVLGLLILFGFLLFGFRQITPSPVSAARQSASFPTPVEPLNGVLVVLDPGHGGADPGTTSGSVSEAALTYRTASELAASLEAQGAKVVYTVRSRLLDPQLAAAEPPLEPPTDAVMAGTGEPLRERHSPRPLWQRAELAGGLWNTRHHSDLHADRDVFFLSLHFDQFSSSTLSGGMVCVDRRCHSVPSLARNLAGLMMQGNLGRDGDFHGIPDLSGRELGVLDPQYNPIPEKALLEVATLSNPENAQEALDPAWRGEVVRRITLAIMQTHQGH